MTIGKANKFILLALLLWMAARPEGWAAYPLTGVVRDQRSKVPIAGAFVLAYVGPVQKGFAYSGEDGHFSINVQDGSTISTIKVSMLGYAPVSVDTGGKTSELIIELKEKAMRLNPATVESHSVRRRGDTLSFYIQAFTDGTEQVLDDLINKIPGLTTNEQGAISYDGEAINRFYVEDLDLLGSKYGVVTKNLKASDIARVDVYLNHQPVNALRDISPSEKSAVNIVLKEDAKGTWMFTGDALLGLPPFPLFHANAMVSRFGKSRQNLYLLNGNNLGSDILQELRDQPGINDTPRFFRLNGDIDSELSSTLSPSFSSLPIPKENWYDNLTGISSFNHLTKMGEHSKMRVSLHAAAEKYSENTVSSEIINFDDGSSMAIEDDKSLISCKYYFQGQATYEDNSPKRFLSEAFSLTGQIRSDLSDGSGRNNYTENYNLPSFKADNNLRLTLRRGNEAVNIISMATYVRNNHTATFDTGGRSCFQSYLQNDFTSKHGASLVVTVGRHSLSADASINLDYIGLNTTLIPSADISGLRGLLQDRLSVFSTIPSLSIRDVVNIGNITITASAPVELHILTVRGKTGVVYPTLSPSLALRYTPTANLTTVANVSYSTRRSSPESLLGSVIMRGYRSLSRADSLNRSRSISTSASIRYSNPVDMVFLSLNGHFARMFRDKSSSREYYPDITVTGYLPLANATSMYNVDGNARKYFGGKVLMIETTAGYKVNETDEHLQNVPVHYVSRSITTGGIIRANPADWFSAWIEVDYIRQITDNGHKDLTSHILTGEGTVRISPLRKLDIELDGYMRKEHIPGVTVFNRPLLKACVSWKLSKATVYLECNNLLDISEYRRETITDYRTVSTVNRLRSRHFLIGIRMSL